MVWGKLMVMLGDRGGVGWVGGVELAGLMGPGGRVRRAMVQVGLGFERPGWQGVHPCEGVRETSGVLGLR